MCLHPFHCKIKTPKWPWTLKGQKYPTYMFTATHDFQISFHFSLRTTVFELQPILRQVHQMTPKWPEHQKINNTTIKLGLTDIWADFSKLPYLGMNLVIGQSFRSCTYTLFLPRGVKIRAYFRSMGSGFKDTGRFSKLPYLGMKLGYWPKFQKLHI